MYKFVLLTALIGLVPFAWTAQTTQKKAPAKKSSAKRHPTASKSAAAKQSGASKTGTAGARASKSGASTTGSARSSTASKAGKRGGKKGPQRRSVASAQPAPTPDRYRQIEQALAERGYLKSEPSGRWGPEAQEAYKKFQQDQNLNPTGKIDSLSLIALGLGPKRSTPPPKAQP